jgi:hypothetical protein
VTSVLTRTGLVLRPCSDPERWDRAVAEHPDGTPFHLTGFLQTVAERYGRRLHLTELEADGEPVGLVPLLVRSGGPFLLINHGLYISYLGPLLQPGIPPAEVVDAVRRFFRPRPVAHVGLKAIRPFDVPDAPGWTAFDDYMRAVVPVGRDDDALIELFSARQRSNLRRSSRAGLTVGPATREEIAESFTAWANEPFVRQGLPPRWPAGFHLAVHDRLATSGVAVSRAVRRDGELVALGTDLVLGNRLFGWEEATSAEGRKLGASAQLWLDCLRRARELGVAEIDLLGVPTPGLAAYKRGLGAEIVPCGVAEWISPTKSAARTLKRAARPPVRLLRRRHGDRA